ncbi:MAG: hypothetical protein F4Z01_06920 [Gammaproteobacteria bacterium]|nr:hypothetical protein [Gammaproteobacteria bacterium]
MPRFRLKQWRETFEEVIIEADNYFEADKLGDNYPDIDSPVEVVNEVESTLRYEVEAIETTKWLAHFDDPSNGYTAESEPFETEDYSDSVNAAKDKAIEWLCGLNDSPYHYPMDIPECVGEWDATRAGGTDTLILWRELANKATLTLVEIWQPK